MADNATLEDLVTQVGNLTEATTELLDATQTSNSDLEKTAQASIDAASRAKTAADSTDKKAAEAKNSASEAKSAEKNAVAVVHNDQGSLIPKPGAYALADKDGHLDIGWTPHLAALYPYSGVMGSVDKGDLFSFAHTKAEHANKFTLKSRQFNINGRFVALSESVITLPEAEKKVERAFAFDDIFLDWNGSVTHHRSITPHRAIAGYNCDAIAKEYGYTKAGTGLYKLGDNYALLLCRVARRNQGGYHPLHNPEGSCAFVSSGGGGQRWYELDEAAKPKKPAACFYFSRKEGVLVHRSAAIGGSSWQLARPDHHLYDAIYSDDITSLCYSAEKIQDRQALLFDSFNRAVAGETFGAAEVTNSLVYECSSVSSTGYPTFKNANSLYYSTHMPGVCLKVVNLRTGTTWENLDFYFVSNGTTSYIRVNLSADIQAGDQVYIKLTQEAQEGVTNHLSVRPQFQMTDIIGSLDAMPDEWKKEGIPGNWIAEGEDNENLIPDGTEKNFKLSRKCLDCYQVLHTNNKGEKWTDVTFTYRDKMEGDDNTLGSHSFAATDLYMVSYKAAANPFKLAVSDKVLASSNPKQLTHSGSALGAVCVSNLIDKVPVGAGATGYQLDTMWNSQYLRSDILTFDVKGQDHSPFAYEGDLNTPRLKLFSYLRLDGALGVFYKEVKYNGSKLGDDNKFNIVDYQSTVTDNNGEKVIVGQKKVELPYQFSGVTY